MDGALAEFAAQGYGASSINAICSGEGISKGIVYHYFETKDELYLACVEECFQRLTAYLREQMSAAEGGVEAQMRRYFGARLAFFQEHPAYQRIFCDAVVMPPQHMEAAIQERKAPFDALSTEILGRLLKPVRLRPGISWRDVVDTFHQYQDYINVRYQMAGAKELDIRAHEDSCYRALNILFYGIIAREDDET